VSGALDIPAFLKLSADERRKAWENRPLTAMRADRLTSDEQFRIAMDRITAENIAEIESRSSTKWRSH